MKKLSFLLFFCVLCSVVGCSLLVRHAYDTQPISEAVRTTVITVGNSIRLRNIDFQNLTTTPGGNVTVAVDTVQPSVRFSTYSGQMHWDAATSKLQFSNDAGATWADIGSGGGGTVYQVNTSIQFGATNGMIRYNGANMQYSNNGGSSWSNIGSGTGGGSTSYALYFPNLTSPLTYTKIGGYPYSSSSLNGYTKFEIALFANISALAGTGGVFFKTYDTTYSCTDVEFGITPSSRLYFQVVNGRGLATYDIYSSAIITDFLSHYGSTWVEYAVQYDDMDWGAPQATFYIDGTVLTSQEGVYYYSSNDMGADMQTTLFDGILGRMGLFKFGTHRSWPTTGYKGISHENRMFPGLFLFFPLTEGTGNPGEIMFGGSFAKHATVTWEAVEGGY